MKPPGLLFSFVAAAGIHALILFGWGLGTAATPLPVAGEPATVDVNLVDPPPGGEVPADPSPEPTPQATPEPTPPPPEPKPDEITEPAPTPQPTPQARPKSPSNHTSSKKPTNATNTSSENPTAEPGNRGSGVSPVPRSRSNPKPDYPREALAAHHEGIVLLAVEVSAKGQPTAITLVQGSGFPELDASAVRTLWRWRFEPARVGGFAIASQTKIPIRFRIEGR